LINREKEIEAIFERAVPKNGPGCSVAVINGGKTLFRRDYGMANMEKKRPIDKGTIFHSASLSKQFTAALIHLFEIDGKLSFEAPVTNYIPELSDCCRNITLSHLIHHTSGLRDQWELLPLKGWENGQPVSNEQILHLLIKQKRLNFPPGSEYLYCTSGYTLLAIVLERLSGVSFSRLCRDIIFSPLKMNSTTFYDGTLRADERFALSYEPAAEDSFLEVPVDFTTVGGTGLKTTVDDLIRWTEEWRLKEVFPPRLFSLMVQPGKLITGKELSYGSGLVLKNIGPYKAYGHGGMDGGFRSYILTIPERGLSIIILANWAAMMPASLAEQTARLFLNGLEEPADEVISAINLPSEILQERASLYFNPNSAVARYLEFKENRLLLRLGMELELEAIDKKQMRIKGRPFVRYLFTEEGMTETIGQNEPVFFRKYRALSPESETLEKYTGSYHSDEIGETFEVEIIDNSLHIKGRGLKKRKLTPLFLNSFLGEITGELDHLINLNIAFEEKDGKIGGFNLNSRDIRNLHFLRTGGSQ